MEENKELTDKSIFKSWVCPKDHTAGITWTKNQLFDFAEHYHKVKSKEDKESFKVAYTENEELLRDRRKLKRELKKAQARVKELEEKPRELLKWFINNYNTELMDGSEVDQVLAEYREHKP